MSQAGITSVENVLGLPLSVSDGGTGDVSFTPYAVITGGTTPTNPLQNVVGVGTLGQVLTSGGAGTLPTWTTIASGVSSVSGTLNRITSTGGANPVIDISVSYVGQSSITTLGTIATGVWNGTAIGPTFGGTGQTTYSTGDILYASAANTLSKLAATTDGFVLTLAAGVPSWTASVVGNVDSFSPDTGTDPVVPDGAGLIDIQGQATPNVSGIQVTGGLNRLDLAMLSPFGGGDFGFVASDNAGTQAVFVENTSNTASSDATFSAIVGGTSAGDPYSHWVIPATRFYALGIDNSDSDTWKLTTDVSPVSPSTGSTLLSVTSAGDVTIPTLTGVLVGAGSSPITDITPANNGVLISSNTAVPSWLAAGSTGQILTATTGAPPSWAAPAAAGIATVTGQLFTASGAFTYTPTAGMEYVIVELIGAGGGGGGANPGGLSGCGGGGGGGGYARFILTAAQVGASLSGSVGALGAAGTAGNNAGSAGGNTTLATAAAWTVNGGGGGGSVAAAGTTTATAGAGGTVTTGTGTILASNTGGIGGRGTGFSSAGAFGGAGGSSQYGRGGPGNGVFGIQQFAGVAGLGYGAGGAGGAGIGTGDVAGGAGIAGAAIFTEFV